MRVIVFLNLLKSMKPSTPAANFHRATKRLLFFRSCVEVKRQTAGPLTNQNYASMAMASHQNFGILFTPSAHVEPVDGAQ